MDGDGMRKLLFCIAYCGTNYHGWQVQENAITIQQTIQNAIERIFQERLPICGCSRTDSGVHANNYYFHMETSSKIPCTNIQRALNTYLPKDIAVKSVHEVSRDFHARYSCCSKEYVYLIWNAPYHSPFYESRALYYPYPLSTSGIKEAMHFLEGRHDFTSFCANPLSTDNIRTIFHTSIEQDGFMLKLLFHGDGFLYNMVRIMVGTLLFVSEKKFVPDDIPQILAEKDRKKAGKTAPPEGLYLNKVYYNKK